MKIDKETVEGFEPDPTIRRKDEDEIKLKSEHKKPEVKRHRQSTAKKAFVKKASTKKRKTTKRD